MVHKRTSLEQASFRRTASQLAALGRQFYRRGWALGTSGNFSAVLSETPLRLAITASGLDKGSLSPDQILEIDDEGHMLDGASRGRIRSAPRKPRVPFAGSCIGRSF